MKESRTRTSSERRARDNRVTSHLSPLTSHLSPLPVAEPPTRFHSGPLCVRMAERYRLISLIPGRRSELGLSIRDI